MLMLLYIESIDGQFPLQTATLSYFLYGDIGLFRSINLNAFNFLATEYECIKTNWNTNTYFFNFERI